MKKILVFILAIIYISTSAGAMVHMHYCMGKVVGISLWQNDEQTCTSCGMSKAKTGLKKCCHDDSKQVKIQSDQKAAANLLFHFGNPAASQPPSVGSRLLIPAFISPTVSIVAFAPGRSNTVSPYILHCTFLI